MNNYLFQEWRWCTFGALYFPSSFNVSNRNTQPPPSTHHFAVNDFMDFFFPPTPTSLLFFWRFTLLCSLSIWFSHHVVLTPSLPYQTIPHPYLLPVGDCRIHCRPTCNGGQWPWNSIFIRRAGLLSRLPKPKREPWWRPGTAHFVIRQVTAPMYRTVWLMGRKVRHTKFLFSWMSKDHCKKRKRDGEAVVLLELFEKLLAKSTVLARI